ncbi:MAG: hypothetical protein ACLFQ0_12780 [Cyclobacteriaceae bacterium]
MLKKEKVLAYLHQVLCVRSGVDKAGNKVSAIDLKSSLDLFRGFPDQKTADFTVNGLAVSKAGFYRKRYQKIIKAVQAVPESQVGINRHRLALQVLASYAGEENLVQQLDSRQKYELL